MTNGWIKIHRKIWDNPRSNDSGWISLWIALLAFATHQPQDKIFKGKRITLKAGQILTGRKFLARKTGVSESKVQRLLDVFEDEGQIEQQKTNRNRLITILNWKRYQVTEQQANNRRTTDEQQVNTYKNIKNVKNDKKPSVASDAGEIAEIIKSFEPVNPMISRLYGNTTQRMAVDRMIQKFGFNELKKMVESLEHIINKPYAPKPTTPCQLEQNLGRLKAWANQERAKRTSKGKKIIMAS